MANTKDLFTKWVESGEVDSNLAIIQSLSMQGQSMEQIAEHFSISRSSLQALQRKHPVLGRAIKAGRSSVVAMCQNKLMEKVSAGDTTAIIYALKVYGGDFFNDRHAIRVATETGDSAVLTELLKLLKEKRGSDE